MANYPAPAFFAPCGSVMESIWEEQHPSPIRVPSPPSQCVLALTFISLPSSSELLIILWGLLFFATRENRTPQLRARNFVQPLKEVVARRRSLSVDSGAAIAQPEELPQEKPFFGGNHPPHLPPRPHGDNTMPGGRSTAVDVSTMSPVIDHMNESITTTT